MDDTIGVIMKVKQLIKELGALPKTLEVYVALNDNAEYETAGDVYCVNHFIKHDHDVDDIVFATVYDRQAFDDMPDEYVIIGC